MKQLQELITAMGKRRFTLLAILAVIALVIAGLWQEILIPQQEQVARDLSRFQSERSNLQTKIHDLPIKHEELVKNEQRYDDLEKQGLFLPQDRIEARSHMEELRQASGLHAIDYKIEPQTIVDTPAIAPTNKQLVLSPMTVEMRGLTDHEIFKFITKLETDFHGLVIFKDMTMDRQEEITPINLQTLKQGGSVDFITAKVDFDWYSISPKVEDKDNSPLSKAFEGSAR